MYEHVSCELLVTGSCSMSCTYCIARDLPGPPMTRDIGKSALDIFFYMAQGAKSVEISFTGGEALLEFGLLKELAAYCRERSDEAHMALNLVLKSNGTILNERVLRFMKEYLTRVVISIDGTADAHDENRKNKQGKGTHALVARNLARILQANIPCTASMTVHPRLSKAALQNVQFLYGLGVRQIDLGPVYGTVTWSKDERDALIESLTQVALYMRDLNVTQTQLEVGPLYQESEHHDGRLCNTWGCRAGSSTLAFLPNGQISGCSALAMLATKFPELVLGDVFKGLDQTSVDRLVELAQTDGHHRPACRACESAANCAGGCLAINYSTNRTALNPPDFYCQTISALPATWGIAWSGRTTRATAATTLD